MVFAVSGYRYISLFAEKWHPIVRIIVCPVETRCSRLLPDRFQYNIHLLSPGFESGFSGILGFHGFVDSRCSRLLPDRFQYNIHLLSPFFESGFSGFSGLQRTSLFWVQWSFVKDYLVPFFSPMRNASAKCQ